MLETEEYLIDYSGWSDEGGYCQVYLIKDHPQKVFKEFRSKTRAVRSYRIHKKLAKFDLAPRIYSKVCRLSFLEEDGWRPDETSDWGYITELAKTYPEKSKIKAESIQELVDLIYEKTGLEFWDSHWYNVGLVLRNQQQKLVCIDTGPESFSRDSNVWGNVDPGPQCRYCAKYECICTGD